LVALRGLSGKIRTPLILTQRVGAAGLIFGGIAGLTMIGHAILC